MLNIERTLATHYPDFVQRDLRSAQTLSRFLGFLFYESHFQKFAADYPHLRGFNFVEEVLRYSDFELRLTERERARIGRPVPHEIYTANGFSARQLARMFRKHVYRLGSGRPIFRSIETVAPAENPQLLRAELAASECLGETRDGKVIYLCTMDAAPCVMREIGRLREFTCRAVGEGTGPHQTVSGAVTSNSRFSRLGISTRVCPVRL